jgi:hypothetical protein
MALAKNLQKKKYGKKIKLSKLNAKAIWLLVFVAVLLGVYGLINLSRIAPSTSQKAEIKLETGDRPLPQKVQLWVTADGGLNMRAEPQPKAKIVILIPSGTQLEAEETEGDWYKVSFMNKTGWVNKGYVTTQPPAEDPAKDYKTLIEKDQGFSLRYPKDWVYQNYGANPATSSRAYYAFGAQLGPQLDPVNLPPIILRISEKEKNVIDGQYVALGGVPEEASVSNLAATKYTYNSSSGVQMTAYIVAKGAVTYIIEETGGYFTELELIVKNLTLN